MCRLRYFEVEVNFELYSTTIRDLHILSFFTGSLCISLTSPATLEHLKFNIRFGGFNNSSFYYILRQIDVWSHLDSITTHPAGSRLQRVDININYSYRYNNRGEEPDEEKVLKFVLDGLPLLHTKGILFVNVEFS
jgi:hypothetical protein